MKSILYHASRLFLGAVFIYASYDKILHPQAFAQAVYNYRILPDVFVNIAAITLPWLELFTGICLVTGFLIPGAAVLSTLMLCSFAGALVFNQIRGLDISCGCFSTRSSEGAADLWTVARDMSFLAISVYLCVRIFFADKEPCRRSSSS
jgi:uncharacterized membrane protein YphA (DoxX/SURF4 family)